MGLFVLAIEHIAQEIVSFGVSGAQGDCTAKVAFGEVEVRRFAPEKNRVILPKKRFPAQTQVRLKVSFRRLRGQGGEA